MTLDLIITGEVGGQKKAINSEGKLAPESCIFNRAARPGGAWLKGKIATASFEIVVYTKTCVHSFQLSYLNQIFVFKFTELSDFPFFNSRRI